MTSIVFLKNKKNGKVYAYINEKVTSSDGSSRYRRKCVGHLDYVTGRIIPNRERGSSPEPSIRTCGVTQLLKKMANDSNLTECLQIVFPDIWYEIMITAIYTLSERRPLCYLQDWIEDNHVEKRFRADVDGISDMLSKITEYDIDSFTKVWKKRLKNSKMTILGVSPVSNYIDRVTNTFIENNYFDQYLELEVCYSDRTPLAYVRHSIPLKDIDELFTVKNNFQKFGIDKFRRLVRTNLCKSNDIESLIADKEDFIIMVPNNGPIFDSLIADNWNILFSTDNISADGASFTNTVRKRINGKNLYIHFFFNTKDAETETSAFLIMIDRCRMELEHEHIVTSHTAMYENYFIVTRDDEGDVRFELNSNMIMKRNATAGYMIIISDRESNASVAKELFDINNNTETAFDDIFNEVDRTNLKLYYKQRGDARLFIQFISLILGSAVNEFLRTIGLIGVYSVSEVIEWMKHVYMIDMPGRKGHLISDLDYRQKVILDASGIDLNDSTD